MTQKVSLSQNNLDDNLSSASARRSDCGVFMLTFIERLSVGESVTFSQADMPAARVRIGASILQGQYAAPIEERV